MIVKKIMLKKDLREKRKSLITCHFTFFRRNKQQILLLFNSKNKKNYCAKLKNELRMFDGILFIIKLIFVCQKF